MKAVVPCAKKEDALFPLIESKPTGLMPIMGSPLVRHLVENLEAVGVEEIYLVTNYKQEMFEKEFEDDENIEMVRQEEINGTGNAIEQCSFIEEDFLVVNGDVLISEQDLKQLVEKHEDRDSDATVMATSERTPKKFGVLSIEDDRVKSIVEKPEDPENTLVNTGVYAFGSEIFDILDSMEGEKDLTDGFDKLIDGGDVRFELVENYWIDVGSPEKLWKADETLRSYKINGTEISSDAEVHDNVDITGNAVIEKGSEIKPGTVIEGRVFIGEDCVVGPNTVIRDSTVSRGSQLRSMDLESSLLFEENIVDPSTFIENSLIAEESDTKSNTTLKESFIGPRSYIDMNNSIRGVKFVPDARTDLGEISK